LIHIKPLSQEQGEILSDHCSSGQSQLCMEGWGQDTSGRFFFAHLIDLPVSDDFTVVS